MSNQKPRFRKLLIAIAAAIPGLLIVAGGIYGLVYASVPEHIRYPRVEHFHFRTQVIVDGQAVDFSADEFQETYDGGTCSALLPDQPFHFHDNIDQMTHVHWDRMSGGEFLKYYGWNFVGGHDGSLGRRFDINPLRPRLVPVHGEVLPSLPDGAEFYVYTGDENGFERKNWNGFLEKNLEEFFSKKSNLKQSSLIDLFKAKAFAQGSEPEITEAELTRINNIIGNVVIFVQKDEPSDEQIRERFDNLVPLQDSACGG